MHVQPLTTGCKRRAMVPVKFLWQFNTCPGDKISRLPYRSDMRVSHPHANQIVATSNKHSWYAISCHIDLYPLSRTRKTHRENDTIFSGGVCISGEHCTRKSTDSRRVKFRPPGAKTNFRLHLDFSLCCCCLIHYHSEPCKTKFRQQQILRQK